jgi:hypothetical protein
VKLGTCEDLMYARLDQLRGATFGEKVAGNLPGLEYLNPKLGWRYRFPFPDEDGIAIGCFTDYSRGVMVSVPQSVVDSFEHDEVCAWYGPRDVGFNVFLPCPQGDKFAKLGLKTSRRDSVLWIEIVMQKQIEGEDWTLVRCPYCRNMARLDRAEAVAMCEHITESHFLNRAESDRDDEAEIAHLKFWAEMVKRIMAGYKAKEG